MQAEPIRYFSTNAGIFDTPDLEDRISSGEVPTVSIDKAVFLGYAPDGGLLMPCRIPRMNWDEVAVMKGGKFEDAFAPVMKGYYEGVLTEDELRKIGHESYGRDGHEFGPFFEKLDDKRTLIRLDEGPTGDFKNYGGEASVRTLDFLRTKFPDIEVRPGCKLKDIPMIMFIVSTSGDTGGAVGSAVRNVPGMGMLIYYPAEIGRDVSYMQAKIMESIGGQNVFVRRVNGGFSEISNIVSQLQKDPDLNFMNLNSANSVNLGRFLPQSAYYVYSYAQLADRIGEEITFVVPSGNFGNLTSGLFAKRRTELPMKFAVAVNENNMFERFVNSGEYKKLDHLIHCTSNSMDVQDPSNLRRLVQFYGGQIIDGELTKAPDFRKMGEDIVFVSSVSNERTRAVLREFYNENRTIHDRRLGNIRSSLDPHGATAYEVDARLRATGYDGKSGIMITAHAGKFTELLSELGIYGIELTDRFKRATKIPTHDGLVLECTYAALKGETLKTYGTMMQVSNGTFRW